MRKRGRQAGMAVIGSEAGSEADRQALHTVRQKGRHDTQGN